MLIHVRHHLKDFTPQEISFLEDQGKENLYAGLAWLATLSKNCFNDQLLQYYFFYQDDQIIAHLPFIEEKKTYYKFFQLLTLKSLTNFYNCDYPLPQKYEAEILNCLLKHFQQSIFQALYIDTISMQKFFNNNLFTTDPFHHFAQRYRKIKGHKFSDILESLPSQLQNTIHRKTKKAEKKFSLKIKYNASEKSKEAIDLYESIYKKAWQKAEPFPHFIPDLIKDTASQNRLFMPILFFNDHPVAAQIWLEWQPQKYCIYKLAFDQDYKDYSPGTILLAKAMEEILSKKTVLEIDFGRGDDAYKKSWLPDKRDYFGITIFKKKMWLSFILLIRKAIKPRRLLQDQEK